MIYVICSKCGGRVNLSDSEFYELVRKEHTALLCQIERLTDTNKRLGDLVRHQRSELHDAELLTDEEYAEIVKDHDAVARLEGYDALQARLKVVEAGFEGGARKMVLLIQKRFRDEGILIKLDAESLLERLRTQTEYAAERGDL